MSHGEVIFEKNGKPLMRLNEYNAQELDFNQAYEELSNYAKLYADNSYTWGYFPELQPDPIDYQACVALQQALKKQLFEANPVLLQHDYALAFIRVAIDEPVSEFGGLHTDVHIGIAHQRDPRIDPQAEIIRLLLNPYTHERTLAYTQITTDELRSKGFYIPTNQYKTLDLPSDIPVEQVVIPPLEDGRIHGLEFCSSLLPHAGVTDEKGHYLISYGAYSASGERMNL